jgi:hypothetical protein
MNHGWLPVVQERVRLSRLTILFQMVVAAIICAPALAHPTLALPGKAGLADLPGTVNFHWLVQERGLLEAAHSRLLMYPASIDRIVLDGFPLDALFSWPFLEIFGWPAGFTVFVFACFTAIGLSTAWLAKSWWGSSTAAVIAGVVAQCNPYLIREVADGRATQLFGAIFLPLCLGFLLKSIAHERTRDGLIAGLFLGLGALSYWYYGVFFSICAGLLFVTAGWENPRKLMLMAPFALGTLFVCGGPALYTAAASQSMPGVNMAWTDEVVHGSSSMMLSQLIDLRDLGSTIQTDRVMTAQLVIFGLSLLACFRSPLRRWAVPSIMLGCAIALAAGPNIMLFYGPDVPGPFHIFNMTGVLRRMWWPDRALVMAVPAIALLAAGGATWVHNRYLKSRGPWWMSCSVITILVLVEAFITIPGLPMPTTWGANTDRARLLAQDTGPVLILPLGSGLDEPDARMLVDQIHHGRPLVNGPMPPSSSTAPLSYTRFTETPGLRHLSACETDSNTAAPTNRDEAFRHLRAYGIDTVYLDVELADKVSAGGQAYRACIESLLNTAQYSSGSLWVYAVPAAS